MWRGSDMFRKAVLLACALAGASWAYARPAQDIDPDLAAYLDEIEAAAGIKRFGPVRLGELEGYDSATLDVTINPSTYTTIVVVCGPSCDEVSGVAYDASGKEIAKAPLPGYDAVIHVPPGNGASIEVKVDMRNCQWDTCPYAIQAFTPQDGQ
jgi:hypothetical protein